MLDKSAQPTPTVDGTALPYLLDEWTFVRYIQGRPGLIFNQVRSSQIISYARSKESAL